MYCPSCANTVAKGLKYCNSCGAKLKLGRSNNLDTPGGILNGLLETLFWMAAVGLGLLVGLVAVMLNHDLRPDVLGAIVIAYLFVLLAICFPIIRQITKLIDARVTMGNWNNQVETPSQLGSMTTAQLDKYREPAMPVTEHTTRTLDEVRVPRH